MMHKELYEMTDEHLLYKTNIYLNQLRADIFEENKSKEEILEFLSRTIFYIDFHLNVNKYDLNHLDETGQELKDMWDNDKI